MFELYKYSEEVMRFFVVLSFFCLFFVTLAFQTYAQSDGAYPFDTEVIEEQMTEAESVFHWCDDDNEARRVIDCKCLVEKFIDLRIERGSVPPKMHLVKEITHKECRNIAGTANMEYVKCMKGTAVKYYNHRPKDYCECYARKWAELFGNWEGKLDESKKYSLRDRAMSYCQRPEAYK